MPAKKKPAKKKAAKRHGRPSLFSETLAAEICKRLGEGEPLASICRDEHMPAVRTISHWKEKHSDFLADFARARDEGFDAIAAECLRIADTQELGVRTKIGKDGMETTEEDMLGHRRLQIETRLKLLAKWDPKRYGEKLEIDQTTRVVPMTGEQLAVEMKQSPVFRREIEELMAKAKGAEK